LLVEIVVDVQEPLDASPMARQVFLEGIGIYNAVGFDDGGCSWYEDGDEDEDEE
jgi:hypothetical protein